MSNPGEISEDMYEKGVKEEALDRSNKVIPVIAIGPVSPQAEDILFTFLNNWVNQFVRKNSDYTTAGGGVSDQFHVMGQYMKLHDKVAKLKRPLWDNPLREEQGLEPSPEFNFESAEEILDDIIGHCFLTKHYLRTKSLAPESP